MKSPRRSAAVLAVAGMACFVPTGCQKMTLSHQAMALNKTVHNHRVDQLLLNVIRASRFEPMAMTTIGGFVQRNTNTQKAGVKFPLGVLATDTVDNDISAEFQQNPEMTMTILDNQKEFVDGFMRPISGETVAFFVKQGWDMELLAYLVVEAIEIPYDDFPEGRREEIREKFPSRVRRDKRGTLYLRIPNDPAGGSEDFGRLISTNVERMQIQETEVYEEGRVRVIEKFVIPDVRAELVLRSPQGVLAYLGELARLSLDPKREQFVPQVKGEPLFLVRQYAKSPTNHEVSVLHRGSFYSIPNSPPSRSMAGLNLVQQLIDLQEKEIDQNPSTLRLIGN